MSITKQRIGNAARWFTSTFGWQTGCGVSMLGGIVLICVLSSALGTLRWENGERVATIPGEYAALYICAPLIVFNVLWLVVWLAADKIQDQWAERTEIDRHMRIGESDSQH